MARERVQVQGLGDAVPGIQPTIQRGGQYSVQVQRAGRNKLMDLADALGQVNPILQEYGKIQQFQYKEGVERGEMEAATADLDTAVENLDRSGEKLVEAGLMPRSQLVGYQRSFRRRIGQRQAKTTYASSLEARMEEVTQNLDSDEDIIESILAEERQKMAGQLGSSQFAMQGFMDYAEDIESRFATTATKKRDRATQDFKEEMIGESLNELFSERVLSEDIDNADVLKKDMKVEMDRIVIEDKIPRSRVIEIFWGSFASPNIKQLLSGDEPQPDKAEKFLDSVLGIDLTGKGGKLGNINRDKAAILSSTAVIRNQIEAARDKIEADEDDVSVRIVNEYNIASNAILTGPTGIEETDNRDLREISRQLQHAGYTEEEAGEIARRVYADSDVSSYTKYLSKFLDSDVTREAFGKASRSFTPTRLQQAQLSNMYLTNRELPELLDRFKQMKETTPDMTTYEFLSSGGAGLKGGPITDKKAKALIAEEELKFEKKKWWDSSEEKKKADSVFNARLTTTVEGVYTENRKLQVDRSFIDQLVEPYEVNFKTTYDDLIKEASNAIDPEDPDRRSKMLVKEKEISDNLLGRFQRLQETIKTTEQVRTRLSVTPFDPTSSEFNEALEKAERDIRGLQPYWAEKILPSIAPIAGLAGVDIEGFNELTIAEQDYQFREQTGASSPLRSKALNAADKFEKALQDEPKMIKDLEDANAPEAYKETNKLIRQRFGYRNIDQVPDFKGTDIVDWRVTPVVAKEEQLKELGMSYRDELQKYYALPLQEQNIEDPQFSTLRKMRDKFGVFDAPQRDPQTKKLKTDNLDLFTSAQRRLFKL
jgi:hypothetical protein